MPLSRQDMAFAFISGVIKGCQFANICPLFSKNFNIITALFSTKRPTCRKKSILRRVCFGTKWG